MSKKRRKKNQRRKNAGMKNIEGFVSVNPAGFGFVKPINSEQINGDVFIPPRYMNSVLDGDKVNVKLNKPSKKFRNKGPSGKITKIIERGRKNIVGELLAGHKVRPLNKKVPDDIKIVGKSSVSAERGDWIEVELTNASDDKKNQSHTAVLKSNLGAVGNIDSDLDAVSREYELAPPYSEKDNSEAAEITPSEIKRKDLSDLFCMTIDPEDAKDFDDAVSLSEGKYPETVSLGIHIADVAAWIRPESRFDKMARERSFTSYLPGRTLPMIPESITKAISLNANEKSFAHSVILQIEKDSGRILSSERFHSIINVKKRLNFKEVQNFIDDEKNLDWNSHIKGKIFELLKLTEKMRERRSKIEKFIELSSIDIRVIVDENEKRIIGLERKTQSEADKIIEECMLAANSAVAVEMLSKHIPALYRIHDEPAPEKIREFTEFVHSTFNFSPGKLDSRIACNNFLKSLKDDHTKPVIMGAFLRSMQRAVYSDKSALHYGLGKGRYLHFTSPIRRYPDLFVHQQLWEKENSGELKTDKTAANFADLCTAKEMNNDEAYYAANDRMKLHYLRQELNEGAENFHEAVISKISGSGLLVDIPEFGIMGFVPREFLPGNFVYSKQKSKYFSANSSKSFSCGDFIYLKTDKIDFIKGKALFRPVL